MSNNSVYTQLNYDSTNTITRAKREARKNILKTLYKDGLTDLKIGIYLLTMSFAVYFSFYNPIDITVPLICVMNGLVIAVDMLRKRTTYPRIGYVNVKTKGQTHTIFLVSLFSLIILIILYIQSNNNSFIISQSFINTIPAIAMAILALAFLYVALRNGITRFMIYIILSIIGCIFFFVNKDNLILHTSYAIGILSFFLILIGITTYIRFIIDTPLQADTAKEGKSRTIQRHIQASFIKDGIEDLLLSLYFIVGIAGYYLFNPDHNVWIGIILLFVPALFGLYVLIIRKRTTSDYFSDKKLKIYAARISGSRTFGVMIFLTWASMRIFNAPLSPEITPLWLTGLIFALLGTYFFINAAFYGIKRFYFLGTVSFLCILLYLFRLPQISQYLLSSAIMAVALIITGWIGRSTRDTSILEKGMNNEQQ